MTTFRRRLRPRFLRPSRPSCQLLLGYPRDQAALGPVAPRIRPVGGRAARLRLLPRAGRRRRGDARRPPRRAGVRAPEPLPLFVRALHGRAVPPRRRVRRAHRRRGARDPPPRGAGHRSARRALQAGRPQPRLEPRPRRRRGRGRPRAPARRPALGGRHELHAGARRREGDARAPGGDASPPRRRLAELVSAAYSRDSAARGDRLSRLQLDAVATVRPIAFRPAST